MGGKNSNQTSLFSNKNEKDENIFKFDEQMVFLKKIFY